MPGLLLGIIAAVYWEIWFKGFVPLPADGLTGMYFPWLDFKWGYQVGVPVKNSLLSDAFGQFFVWKKIKNRLYLELANAFRVLQVNPQ